MPLDFTSADFVPATPEERISKCRAMAEEAMMKAYWGHGGTRGRYLLLATHWTEFAKDIARR